MCCLFGIMDCNGSLTGKERGNILHYLAAASEARGTDATGIAYNSGGKLHIYKRPLPGHLLRFHIPEDARTVMGHTRLSTQGSERHNYNNHPFKGRAGGTAFALAHNGVLYNDIRLRKTQKLPNTNIETDSFVAVQLLEQRGTVSFDGLKYMAERVEGPFCFTVLDGSGNLYFVKGDNPLCIYHYPKLGLFLYASTEEILNKALTNIPYKLGAPERIWLDCGELLRIDAQGKLSRGFFDASGCWYGYSRAIWSAPPANKHSWRSANWEYRQLLKATASHFGFSPEAIDAMLDDGYSTDEVEELLYCGEI